MVRRFAYVAALDRVVELGELRSLKDPAVAYATERADYDHAFNTDPNPRIGDRLTQATLEKAERREWAHKRFGDERRWSE